VSGLLASEAAGFELVPSGTGPEIAGRTPWQIFWQRLREDRVALFALAFIVLEVLAALFAPWIVKALGHAPDAQYPGQLDPTFGTPTGPSRSLTRLGEHGVRAAFREPELGECRGAPRVEEDVRRLHVPVHEAAAMERV
jgi:oligopeptide transport permease C-like protein